MRIFIVICLFLFGASFISAQQTVPTITIASNREVLFNVPMRQGTQYIRAYIMNGDKYVSCYFHNVPDYNGECTRAHETQFKYYVEYLDGSGNILATYGPLQIFLLPTSTPLPTKTPIPTPTPYRVILPIIIR